MNRIFVGTVHKQYSLKTQESGITTKTKQKNNKIKEPNKTQSQHLSQLYFSCTTFPILQTSEIHFEK